MNFPNRHPSNTLPGATVALLLLSLICTLGCVNRRLVIRTEPEGASVTVDGYPVGNSPVATRYTHGGSREIQIEKDGYKTVKVLQDLSDPWYLRPPFSFVTENFWPVEIRHQPQLEFQLEPKTRVNEAYLLQRANTLRTNVQQGTVTAPAR